MESKPQIPALRSVGKDEPGALRIGPYSVVRDLVAAPGAELLEACTEDGAQVLLQVVRCRPARDETEAVEKIRMLDAVARETFDASTAGFTDIRDHGHAETGEDTVIYWALPWTEEAVGLGLARIDTDDELVSVGILLAKRLQDLHESNRLDPLLSERVIVIEEGEPTVIGAPIRVPDKWLARGIRPARLAPEETLAKEPTKAGDLWRLGQTLKALTVTLDRLPTRVWRALELLGHPDVGIRIRTAVDALQMLEALTDPDAPDPPSESDLTRARAPRPSDEAQERTPASFPPDAMDTIADLSLPEARSIPPDAITETTASSTPAEDDADSNTLLDFQMPQEDQGDHVVVVEPERVEESRGMMVLSGPDSSVTLAEAAIPEMRKKRATWNVRSKGSDAGPTGTVMERAPKALVKRPQAPAGPEVDRRQPPQAMMLGPRGTVVGEGLVGPIRRAQRVGEEPEEESTEKAEPAEEADPTLDQPIPSPRTAAVAFLTFVVGLLLGAVASKGLQFLEDNPELLGPTRLVPSTNTVRLDATPAATAVVVGEVDGKILGRTPLDIQIPMAGSTAVLVAAPGHEPARVVLPDRGEVSVTLRPNYRFPTTCSINLHIPGGVPVESIGAPAKEDSTGFRVPGAAVIRATQGPGAWLLRCPELGGEGVQTLPGRALPPEVEIRVSKPVDMEVFIDGELAGTSPLRKRIPAGFTEIRIKDAKGEALARWVPAFADTELELPHP